MLKGNNMKSILKINKEGNRYWKNEKGKLHRDRGPAIEWNDGSKEWYIEGKLHRLDGPAIEWSNGIKKWYKEDKEYTKEEFNKYVSNLKKIQIKDKIK